MRKLEGVESVKVSLEEGSADVRLKGGNALTLEELRRAIRHSGFTPREAEVTARGTLTERGGRPALEVTGLGVIYRLRAHSDAAGKLEALERAAPPGSLLEVSGTLRELPEEAPELLLRDFRLEGPESAEKRPGAVLTVQGRLTEEGVECPAMRGEDGTLYTLTGKLGTFRPGDEVCVRGRVAEISFCMQGTTLIVEHIGRTCP